MSEEMKNNQENNEAKNTAERRNPDAEKSPMEQITEIARGTMKLLVPLRASNIDFTELEYDYLAMKNEEYANAMDADRDPLSRNAFRVSVKQGLAMFAVAVDKVMATKGVDKNDVLERLSTPDTIRAAQISSSFFASVSRAGGLFSTNK